MKRRTAPGISLLHAMIHTIEPDVPPPTARDTELASPEDRAARGKAIRAEVPRSSYADWAPATEGRDPVAILEAQAASRLPELVPLRYERMLVSPFSFFRGAAAVMAADLADAPRSGMRVQLCGDAHVSNFGGFASPERDLVFDINDFDETLAGPWEWDVARLAASVEIAGRDLGHKTHGRYGAVRATVRSYREAMRRFASMRHLDVWYARLDAADVLQTVGHRVSRQDRDTFAERTEKARTKDSLRAFSRLTEHVDGRPRIISDPPLVVPIEELAPGSEGEAVVAEIQRLLELYGRSLRADRRALLERHAYAHMARKVVGVGSVGTRAWIVLLLGRDDHDPLFLQVKEAEASVLEPFAGAAHQSNHAQRVVEGQWLMQASSDIFLGWLRTVGLDGRERDFYVRQLWDWKRSVEIERLNPHGLELYARMCGWTLARAHARSGDRIAIAAYLGAGDAFDKAIAEFSESYADQSERDHAALVAAIESGRIAAEEI
jgi:uncharacterized protein (DUF2252 family)